MDHSKKDLLKSLIDDESITTSTESDSVETWTLVNDKTKKNENDSSPENLTATNNRIDILTNFTDSPTLMNKEIHGNVDYRSDDDSNVDDISEGISIISESESAGRSSPLAIEENLSNENFNNYSNLENISPNSKLRLPIHIRQSSYLPSTAVSTSEKSLRQRRIPHSNTSEISDQKTMNQKIVNSIVERTLHPLVRHCLKRVFFICVTLVILAFIGKLLNPDWKPWLFSKNVSVLEEKLTNLELKNNLMRAEIDILSKQVNYLTALWEKSKNSKDNYETVQKFQHHHYKKTDEMPKKQKSDGFKAWSGNGNNLDPVQITKHDLKKAYDCPDGNFREIAGMCVQKVESKIKNMEDIFNKVNDAVVEQIFEDMDVLQKDSTDKTVHLNEQEFSEVNQNKNYMKKQNRNSNKKDEYISEKKYDTTKQWKQHQHLYSEGDEWEGFGRTKTNSKEVLGKRYERRSNERHYDRASTERLPKNGEWHGKLMKQREAARNEKEIRQRRKNWYIERGNEREKMRHS